MGGMRISLMELLNFDHMKWFSINGKQVYVIASKEGPLLTGRLSSLLHEWTKFPSKFLRQHLSLRTYLST
jgi:hypothetical protein